MRPKKVILLVDRDEYSLSLRRLVLETRGYRVVSAETCADAMEILGQLKSRAIDLIVGADGMAGLAGLLGQAKQTHPMARSLVLSEVAKVAVECSYADVFLPEPESRIPAVVLEKVRILMVRKRGPRKIGPRERMAA